MVVLWKNKMWTLENMPWRLFQNLQRTEPNVGVEIIQLTQSSYKEKKKAPIGELQDWSVARNLQALGRN